MSSRGRITTHISIPLKVFFGRVALALMITASFSLLILSKTDSTISRTIRLTITEVMVPVMDVVSRPFDAASAAGNWLGEMASLRAENVHLKAENAQLLRWQSVAREMEAENRSLHALLNFAKDQGLTYSSARIVGGGSGPLVRTALINAGTMDGIERYQAVISDRGLVGRVVEAGLGSAHVQLITDINSRIPVMLENARERGILAGNNTDTPVINYLPDDTRVAIGERVVTAGDNHLLPPGLPVGIIIGIENGQAKVLPLVDWYRLEHVSAVHYNFE